MQEDFKKDDPSYCCWVELKKPAPKRGGVIPTTDGTIRKSLQRCGGPPVTNAQIKLAKARFGKR